MTAAYSDYNDYFNGTLKKGDKFRFSGSTYEFVVSGTVGESHDLCTKVTGPDGASHYLYLMHGEVSHGLCAGLPIDVSQKGPDYKFGRAYRDQDGEYFLRGSKDCGGGYRDGWLDSSGDFYTDDDGYVRLPMEGPFE